VFCHRRGAVCKVPALREYAQGSACRFGSDWHVRQVRALSKHVRIGLCVQPCRPSWRCNRTLCQTCWASSSFKPLRQLHVMNHSEQVMLIHIFSMRFSLLLCASRLTKTVDFGETCKKHLHSFSDTQLLLTVSRVSEYYLSLNILILFFMHNNILINADVRCCTSTCHTGRGAPELCACDHPIISIAYL
jgi:hypothetical protein